jgi:dienelactone hydrolase
VTKSSAFSDRQREASALEHGGTGSKRGGMGLLLTALVAGVLGGGIITGTLFATADAHRASRATTVMQPAPTTSPSPAPAEATRRASAMDARAAPGPVDFTAQSQVPRGDMAMSTSASAPDRVVGPYGRGGGEVWIVLPNAPLRSVVVFGHGWKLTPRSPGHPWVDQFRPWLDHLAAGGSAVIFPSYQLGSGDTADATRVRDWAAAIQTGYVRLGRPNVPFVAIGYSFGASLAFYYAANARTWRLPVPRAVQAIFPAGMIAGALLPALAPSVRVLIQVGDADTEAGRGGADAFWNWLSSHPAALKSYEVIHSTPQFVATHAAPKSTSPAARRAFWAPLDRLIALARGA